MASVALVPGGIRRKEIRGAKRAIRIRAKQMVERYPFLIIVDELDEYLGALHLTDGLPEDIARDDWLKDVPLAGGGQEWLL